MCTVSPAGSSGKTLSDLVDFQIECVPEDSPVRGNAMASGDNAFDQECEDKILADLEWNEWAWCTVKVTATFGPWEGTDYLGCCSYQDEEGFKQGGYWKDMQHQAFTDLLAQMDHARTELERAYKAGLAEKKSP